jgi:hypothetical protein
MERAGRPRHGPAGRRLRERERTNQLPLPTHSSSGGRSSRLRPALAELRLGRPQSPTIKAPNQTPNIEFQRIRGGSVNRPTIASIMRDVLAFEKFLSEFPRIGTRGQRDSDAWRFSSQKRRYCRACSKSGFSRNASEKFAQASA